MKIKRFEFNMFPVNCYVLWDDTKEAVVIDPGCFYEEEKQALKKFILTNELTVKHLLNTHLHLDHIFGNPFMLKESVCRQKPIRRMSSGSMKLRNRAVCSASNCRKNRFHWGNICMTEISSPLDIPNWKRPCPGHSPGSLVYYCKEENCMFSR